MKPLRTWILIADGGRARVLLHAGHGAGLTGVPGLTFKADLPSSHELGSDRPGRVHESHGLTRHAIEPHADLHQQLKHRFISSLIETLNLRLEQAEFDRLVLVAPPTVLGWLRADLSNPLRQVVMAEIGLDLTKTPNDEIAAHLDHKLNL